MPIAGSFTIPHVECYDGLHNEWYDATDMNVNRSALKACVLTDLPNVKDYTYHGTSLRTSRDRNQHRK